MRFPTGLIAAPMPGKQPRVLCPVCQEPIPPDETECENCGGFVAAGDSRCSRCSAEFEPETEEIGPAEEDILDIVLCPICGADNDSDAPECEICGEPLKEVPVPRPSPEPAKAPDAVLMEDLLARVDDFLGHVEP